MRGWGRQKDARGHQEAAEPPVPHDHRCHQCRVSGSQIEEIEDEVKDEVICFHTERGVSGGPWPRKRDSDVVLWEGNRRHNLGNLIQSLDATLFQYNMRAWSDLQTRIGKGGDAFDWYHMNTAGGARGLLVVCTERLWEIWLAVLCLRACAPPRGGLPRPGARRAALQCSIADAADSWRH